MKTLLSLCLFTFAYAEPLILVGEHIDKPSLEQLSLTYQKSILVADGNAYLVPKSCALERFYGGISQGNLKEFKKENSLPRNPSIFEAKDDKAFEQKDAQDRAIAIVEGSLPEAFINVDSGRHYAGVSQAPLNLSQQMRKAQITAEAPVRPLPKEQKTHPSCELLEDGSGYRLHHVDQSYFYTHNKQIPVLNNTVLFDNKE